MEESPKQTINEDFVMTLIKDVDGSQIKIHKVEIINQFQNALKSLKFICDQEEYSLQDLINFLNSSPIFNQLDGKYKYCVLLAAKTQPLIFNNIEQINEIINYDALVKLNVKTSSTSSMTSDGMDRNRDQTEARYKKNILEFKNEVYDVYELISKAYSIRQAYRTCYEDSRILTFSHRIRGWSSPAMQLSSAFSLEFKTNFGFGNSSYFYVKLKYKNIEICPISEWINYENAKFSEIIRYTRSYTRREPTMSSRGTLTYTTAIANSFWHHATIFVQEAYNCSIKNESNFVEMYILKECQVMVKGLKNIMKETIFTFQKDRDKTYTIDKAGHELIDFRGEKISGALDFIAKIVEFSGIFAIADFISTIEDLNRSMHPIIKAETLVIMEELTTLNLELNQIKPKYNVCKETYKFYSDQKQYIKNEIVIKRKIRDYQVDNKEVLELFKLKFPEYDEFYINYEIVLKDFTKINEQIAIRNAICMNMKNYKTKIEEYFKYTST